ncbi:hypothetical protein BpJC7_12930 [Weizmannia acidilactici]|uniref:PucR C-terminal helix-turn-helix domain-containing protein n=1 Tax=Weizmannia acidilactici TaxID=2607726 RepID=A0A5J4JHG5_9BACI|nr:helix-turn-helix domain-containing protein [Weizmannia acidilactici]GER65826.1 hypothetical protein BpJC4_02970 [Weizmannia acidilactici]GER69990.1 hypothetical protein BpJC7_12930 [Weizmannia acidilactici]GER73077.1 hypothetical protein BpPP18_11440 [Weizmannia acidilactici]
MLERLKARYPNACCADAPIPMKHMVWFWLEEENQYIGIDPGELTREEMLLLKTVFPKFYEEQALFGEEASKWYEYLFLPEAQAPIENENAMYRITQFSIAKEVTDSSEVQEALKNMYVHNVTVAMINKREGIIIEEKNQTAAAEDDLQASIHAFESDFYIPISLYLGEFKTVKTIKPYFRLEQQLFEFALSRHKKPALYTMHSVLPLYLLEHMPEGEKKLLFESLLEIFKEDRDMLQTVKLYLENFTNASLTAKQLFIHRNSLQYRIEKFEEKSGLNLKNFTSAMLAYLACLQIQ